jgi:hypothetical protein
MTYVLFQGNIMSIRKIEERLSAARNRLEAAAQALGLTNRDGEREAYWAAHEAVLQLEREVSAAKGEEHAVPLDLRVNWDAGAPRPHLLRNDYRCFLTFHVREHDPGWGLGDVTLKDPGSGGKESLALVEFSRCMSAKLGSPNDEVFDGHPLSGKGLDAYTAQRVVNSRWLVELEAVNSVHRCYDPAWWRRLNHYVIWFHDTTFECVAESFKVELYRESMADLLARVCGRLLA